MPQQETYFNQQADGKHVMVLKSYDRKFARDAFDHMDAPALKFLQTRLDVGELEDTETLWEEIEGGAREDWNSFSYFVVTEATAGSPATVFVSADWPTAEAFAQQRLQPA
jgi:hypothetical protein